MKTPPTDEFERDGWDAFQDGYELDENPHDADTDRWHGWTIGHATAQKTYELEQGEGIIS